MGNPEPSESSSRLCNGLRVVRRSDDIMDYRSKSVPLHRPLQELGGLTPDQFMHGTGPSLRDYDCDRELAED